MMKFLVTLIYLDKCAVTTLAITIQVNNLNENSNSKLK